MIYIIRDYRESDTRQLMTLFYETVHSVNTADYSTEQINAWASTTPDDMDQEAWTARLGSKYTLVAETDAGLLIGFANLQPMAHEVNAGHIDQFYSHKDYQGIGIGKAIFTGLEAEARRKAMSCLYTEASITARPFFERHGFHTITEQTVERFGVGLTNFRMMKALDTERLRVEGGTLPISQNIT